MDPLSDYANSLTQIYLGKQRLTNNIRAISPVFCWNLYGT